MCRSYDRSRYEAIRDKARGSNQPAAIQAVHKLCRDYLEQSNPPNAMTGEVETWEKWFDGWNKGKEFYVRVVWVRIDRESVWHHRWSFWNPEVWVTVSVNGKALSTKHKTVALGREERDIPNNLLGPFFWKWNDPDVRVIFHHKDATPPNFASTFDEDEAFKIRNFNPKLPISHDGGKIGLMLECTDVEPPLLPLYKDLDK